MSNNDESENKYRMQKHLSDEDETMLKEEDYQCCQKLRRKNYFIEHNIPVDAETDAENLKNEWQYKLQVMQNHGISLDKCLDRITEQKEKDKKEYDESIKRWEKQENEL